MKKFTLYLLLILTFTITERTFSQTLSAQDIVVLQINSDGGAEEIALLTLVDIPANEIFYISDISWNNTGSTYGNSSERGIKVTVNSSGLTAGTIIRIDNPTGGLYTLEDTTQGALEFYEVDGSVEVTISRELSLSTSGDQIMIFQTADGVITSSKTFIYALNYYDPGTTNGWDDNSTIIGSSSLLSHLPSSLSALDNTQSNKTTASAFGLATYLGLGATYDNFQYTGPVTTASKSDWLIRIHTITNWSATETTLYSNDVIASGGNVTVTEPNSTATLTTTDTSDVSGSSATLAGNITDDGGASVTDRGIVYAITSENANPEIGGANVTQDTNGSGTGIFSENITGLSLNTGYSFRAYAINSEGTSYGDIKTFTTNSTLSTDVFEISKIHVFQTKNNVLELTGLDGKVVNIEVYDMLGKQKTHVFTETQLKTSINTHLSSGIYIVYIKTKNQTFAQKIILK